MRGHLSAVDADRNLYLFVSGAERSAAQQQRLIDRSASQLFELFSIARADSDLDKAAARTWAYTVIGAFQTVTAMWLADEYCDRDLVARDLTELLWHGIAAVGEPR